MARMVRVTPSKTYSSEARMAKAVALLQSRGIIFDTDRYLVCRDENGRVFPVFLYNERTSHFMPALLAQNGFCCIN